MRKPTALQGKIAIDMTPMIDIVFQLLIFFVMTLNIVPPEGDLGMQMPVARPGAGAATSPKLPPLTLTLRADEHGDCSAVLLNERSFAGERRWEELHVFARQLIGEGKERADVEVEIVADFDLKHEYAVQAVTALAGSRDANGDIEPLVEKIRFADPVAR